MVRIGLGSSSDDEDSIEDTAIVGVKRSIDGSEDEQGGENRLNSEEDYSSYEDESNDDEDEYDDDDDDEYDDDEVDHGLVVWPPIDSMRDGYHSQEQQQQQEQQELDDDYDINRSIVGGVALPAHLGMNASRVQLLNSVLFQEEYQDEDGIRRVAALPKSTSVSRAHSWMRPQDNKPTNNDETSFIGDTTTALDSSMMVPHVEPTVNRPPAPRFFTSRQAAQHYAFRVGWGCGNRLAISGEGAPFFFGQEPRSPSSSSSASNHVQVVCATPPIFGNAEAVSSLLMVHRRHFSVSPPGAHFAGNSSLTTDAFLRDVISEVTGETRLTWQLVHALWGPVEEDAHPNPFREHRVRRRRVSQWLMEACAPQCEAQLRDATGLRRAAVFLSGGRVAEAVDCCISEGHPRLAATISACATTLESKKAVMKQLETWAADQVLGLMDPDAVLCLQMVTGATELLSAKPHRLLSLDWRAKLGLLLWYRFTLDKPVEMAVRTLENVLWERHEAKMRCDMLEDAQFQLFRLYAWPALDAKVVLRPENFREQPCDWLQCWLLRWVLHRLSQRNAAAEARVFVSLASDVVVARGMTTRVAEQLEALGLWWWAVHVWIMCADTDQGHVRRQVEQLVDRWAPDVDRAAGEIAAAAALPAGMVSEWRQRHPWIVSALWESHHLQRSSTMSLGYGAHSRTDDGWRDEMELISLLVDNPKQNVLQLGRIISLAVLRATPSRTEELARYVATCKAQPWIKELLKAVVAVAGSPGGGSISAQLSSVIQDGVWQASIERALVTPALGLETSYALGVVASRCVDAQGLTPSSISAPLLDDCYARSIYSAGELLLQPRQAK